MSGNIKSNVKSISACFYHDDRLGPTHCNVCLKPLCDECVKRVDGGSYCSHECARKAAKAMGQLAEIQQISAVQEAAAKQKNLQTSILYFFIIIAMCFLFVYGYRNWMPEASRQQFIDLINNHLPFLDWLLKFLEGK